MPLRATNWHELAKRGARIDNAEYVFYVCAGCGRIVLYEEEFMALFYSPAELKRGGRLYSSEDEIRCPDCGAVSRFMEADESHREAVQESHWGFAL
jgi:DNA-directed RNA polymerase subunit RPC12/RpoP